MIARLPVWTEAAERGLSIAAAGTADFYREEVNAGRAELWQDGETYFVTRTEREGWSGRVECVVCLFEGRDLLHLGRAIIAAARRAGCDSIRFHTRRPALGAWMGKAFGFEELERVYRLELTDGQQKQQ